MKFEKLIKERYSCRKFKDKAVEQEKIDKILEAGLVAPTACNLQPQRILVLTDKDKIKADAINMHGFEQSISLDLPPLSTIYLKKTR